MPESPRGPGTGMGCRGDCSAGEEAAGARGRIQPLQTEAGVGAALRQTGWHRKASCRRVTHAAPAAPVQPILKRQSALQPPQSLNVLLRRNLTGSPDAVSVPCLVQPSLPEENPKGKGQMLFQEVSEVLGCQRVSQSFSPAQIWTVRSWMPSSCQSSAAPCYPPWEAVSLLGDPAPPAAPACR